MSKQLPLTSHALSGGAFATFSGPLNQYTNLSQPASSGLNEFSLLEQYWLGDPSTPPITPAFPTTFISHLIGR